MQGKSLYHCRLIPLFDAGFKQHLQARDGADTSQDSLEPSDLHKKDTHNQRNLSYSPLSDEFGKGWVVADAHVSGSDWQLYTVNLNVLKQGVFEAQTNTRGTLTKIN